MNRRIPRGLFASAMLLGLLVLPRPVLAQELPVWVRGFSVLVKWSDDRRECTITVEPKRITQDALGPVPTAINHANLVGFKPPLVGAAWISVPGEPQLPFAQVQVQLSEPSSVSAEAEQIEQVGELDSVLLAPARPPMPEIPGTELPPIEFGPVYHKNAFFPEKAAEPGAAANFRGVLSQTVNIYPLRYNPVLQRLRLYKITAKVRLEPPEADTESVRGETVREERLSYSSIFAKSYLYGTADYAPPANEDLPERPEATAGADYLIFVTDDLARVAAPLEEHRKEAGLVVKLVALSRVGIQANDSPASRRSKIRQRIDEEYGLLPKPSFVLLVGTDKEIPPFEGMYHPSYFGERIATDLYYGTVAGNDMIPDIAVGRLPAASAEELGHMIDKILKYEASAGEGRALIAAEYENGRRYVQGDYVTTTSRWFHQTAHDVYTFLRSPGLLGPQRVASAYTVKDADLPRPWHYYDGSVVPDDVNWLAAGAATNSVLQAWGSDVRLALHRDHGLKQGWHSPPFQVHHFDSLPEPSVPPIVFSINCESGWYDHPTTESFAEELLRHPRGACAVIAASRISWSKYNDRFAEGLVKGIWPAFGITFVLPDAPQEVKLGAVHVFAKQHLLQSYADDTAFRTVELFNLFGDPAMRVLGHTDNAGLTEAGVFAFRWYAAAPSIDATESMPGITPKKVRFPNSFAAEYR